MDHSLYEQEITVNGDKTKARRGAGQGRGRLTEITVEVTERAAPNRTATRTCSTGSQIAQAQNDCISDILSQ